MNIMVYIWLGVFILSLIVELVVPALVSIWFCAGSLVSMVMAIFLNYDLLWLQIIVFVVVSIVTIILLRPIVFKKTKVAHTNVDSLINQVGTCTEDINKYEVGAVKINGLVWSAYIDENDEEIKKGDLIQVKEVNGNKLFVKKYIKEEK